MRKLLIFLGTVLAAGALLAGAVVVAAPQLAAVATAGSGDPEPIDLNALDSFNVRSQVLASDGSVLSTLHGAENRSPVTLDKVPDPVKNSIIAVEDAEFYQHEGINARALARALVENVSKGGVEQGGSTITQQLVKNALLTSERSLDRKVKEAVLAIRLEKELSKEQILETYLNTVYFGSGAYGVQAAAETYWGKNVADLSWAEGAMLAALISNPIAYDPTLHPDVAREQRTIALDRLVSLGELTRAEADFINLVPLPTSRCNATDGGDKPAWCGDVEPPTADSYFVEEVKQQLLADPRLGATKAERYNAVFGGGLRIYTTLDPAAQFAAEVAWNEETPKNSVGVTSSFVAVEPGTGAVRALVGGPPFSEDNKLDLATSPRQTGSTFKLFVLLETLEQGAIPDDRVSGSITMTDPGTLKPYSVSGVGGTLTSVTSASSNGAFVRLNQVVGPANTIDLANRMGIPVSSDYVKVPALPLGVANVTPLQMAAAYNSVPSGGVYHQPYFVDRVEDRNGKVLFETTPSAKRVVSAQSACLATDILAKNVESGTGKNARLPNQVAAGKTGTTTGPTDVWFVGFTPYLTTAVWMGNPQEGGIGEVDESGRPTRSTSLSKLPGREAWGSTYPAAIWERFNELYHRDKPPLPFQGCEPLDRGARPLTGDNDPFGTLNGGYDPTGVGVISGPMKGKASTTRPPSTSGSGRTPTTTAPADQAPADQQAPAPTAPPATAAPAPTAPPSTKVKNGNGPFGG